MHLWVGVGGWRSPTAEMLRQEWRLCRGWFMDEFPGLPGTRPWAWWDARDQEPPPVNAQPFRLGELGELTDSELDELRTQAEKAQARTGTPAEYTSRSWSSGPYSVDERVVEKYERIVKALP